MSASVSRRRRRSWRFGNVVFDESSWTLKLHGQVIALEGKPLEVLHELLLRAGEVVTKDELLDAVWPGVAVVEGSVATAVSKLRKAIGDRDDAIIETVPRIGYRIVAPVELDSLDTPVLPKFAFKPGDVVPGRSQWLLVRPLSEGGADDVWLARHAKTDQLRVFKFAEAPDRLRDLKREAALTRVMQASLQGEAPCPALLEWNFEKSPYFLEYEYGGPSLADWAKEAGGLDAIPLEHRLRVASLLAQAVAAVHECGILHKDLKPANVLIEARSDGPVIRLIDFGSGALLDDRRLIRFRMTDANLLDTDAEGGERSGTQAYLAPELIRGAVPTVRSDIYALGLVLYQLVVGDSSAALAPGWEADVADPLLRDDIRTACAGNPEARLPSAAMLAQRLERLDERRIEAAEAARREAEALALRAAESRRLARQPWMRAAAASIAIGVVASSGFAAYAWSQRTEAVAAQELADTSYSFLAEDVLSSPDPARSSAQETVIDAMKRASAGIDARFAAAPAIAARLQLAVARAFHARSDFDTARTIYKKADDLFAKAGERDGDDAVIGRLNHIQMEAVSGQPNRLQAARTLLEAEKARLGARGNEGRLGFFLAQAEGAYAYADDAAQAERAFARAVRLAQASGSNVPAAMGLKARSSLVLTKLRLGKAREAEPLARAIVTESVLLRGAEHADTLVTQQHWVTTLTYLGRYKDALAASAPLLARMGSRFGDDHRFTLALRSTRFESYAAMGDYSAAAVEAKAVWAKLAGPNSHQAIVGQIDHGAALCQSPRKQEGAAVAADALARSLRAFGPDYALTHTVRYYHAECLLSNGKYERALPLLNAIDRKAAAELTGRKEFGGMVDLALAEASAGLGDRARANLLLTAASVALKETSHAGTIARLKRLRDRI
jgi:eukaryotic-like serine/threonine-protein kinase